MIEDQDVRRISHNIFNNPLGVAVVRGDLLVANSTPTLARKAVGAANTALTSDGNDPSYTKISTAMITPGADDTIMYTTGGASTWTARSSLITAPGLVFIESKTASASATIDFTSGLTSTYDEYLISLVNVVPATDGDILRMRVSQSASFLSGASDYGHVRIQFAIGGAAPAGVGLDADNAVDIINAIGNASGEGYCGSLRISTPADTSLYKLFRFESALWASTSHAFTSSGMGIFKLNTSAIDGIRFFMNAGNITSGTFRLYGIRKS